MPMILSQAISRVTPQYFMTKANIYKYIILRGISQ